MVRCLLNDAKLPNYLWGEAILTANYIQNRLVTSSVPATPYELWENKKPDIENLKLFGSKAYALVPKEKLRKLDDRSQEYIFVGYDSQSKGYRLLDMATKQIVISRDVKFIESSEEVPVSSGTSNEVNNESEVLVEEICSKEASGKNDVEVISIEESGTTSEIVLSDDNSFCSLDEYVESPVQVRESLVSDLPIDNNQENNLRRSARTTKGKKPDFLTLQASKNEIIEPKTYNEAIQSSQKNKWLRAMEDEIGMLKKNNTWDLVIPPPNANIVSCKWTYKVKRDVNDNIKQYKARLVARGFSQKYGSDYNEIFAPVVQQSTLRTMLSVAGVNKMIVMHIDVKSAFLNGVLDNDIFMSQPPGFVEKSTQHVCKLKKSIYGLKQAASVWNKTLHNVLLNGGFVQNLADPCFYTKYLVEEGNIYLLIYVDDILIAAKNKKSIFEVENLLKSNFEINNLGEIRHYLGSEVTRDKTAIFVLDSIFTLRT